VCALLQGRLASADKSLSKNELTAILKFGADHVFKQGEDEDITDADIDLLLAKVRQSLQSALPRAPLLCTPNDEHTNNNQKA